MFFSVFLIKIMPNRLQKTLQKWLGVPHRQAEKAKVRRGSVPFTDSASIGQPEYADMKLQAQMEQYKSWVYACIRRIADELATIELRLYKKKTDDNSEEVTEHPALDVINFGNNQMTKSQLLSIYGSMSQLSGENYWWIIKSGTEPQMIFPYFNPANISVNTKNQFISSFTYGVPGTGQTIDFKTDEMIQFKKIDPLNAYRGTSPVKSAGIDIDIEQESNKFNWNFFKNGAQVGGMLSTDQELSDTTRERLLKLFESKHQGGKNAHKTMVVEQGLDYKQIAETHQDMQFNDQQKFARDKILAIFGVPKSVLGIVEDVNRANAEASNFVFMRYTVKPAMREFVDQLNEFYLPMFTGTEDMYFDFDDPVPEDVEARNKVNATALSSGWRSINEVRQEEGRDPVKGGDALWMPANQLQVASTDDSEAVEAPKEEKHVMKKYGKPRNQKIKETIEGHKHIFKKMLPKRKFDESKVKSNWALKYWSNKMVKTDKREAEWKKRLLVEWKKQADRVIKTVMKKAPRSKSIEFLFDLVKENKIMAAAFGGSYLSILEQFGEEGLNTIGLSGFDTADEMINYIDKMDLKFANSMNIETRERIRNIIKEGITDGQPINTVRDNLDTIFKDKIRSAKIARTEVSRVSNYGTKQGWIQSGVVDRIEWLTAGDERVCPFCTSMMDKSQTNGKTIDIQDNFFELGDVINAVDKNTGKSVSMKIDYEPIQMGALHVNCRCTAIPITTSKSGLVIARKNLKQESDEADRKKTEADEKLKVVRKEQAQLEKFKEELNE